MVVLSLPWWVVVWELALTRSTVMTHKGQWVLSRLCSSRQQMSLPLRGVWRLWWLVSTPSTHPRCNGWAYLCARGGPYRGSMAKFLAEGPYLVIQIYTTWLKCLCWLNYHLKCNKLSFLHKLSLWDCLPFYIILAVVDFISSEMSIDDINHIRVEGHICYVFVQIQWITKLVYNIKSYNIWNSKNVGLIFWTLYIRTQYEWI